MKIVVCIKQIIHTYARTGTDPDSNYLSPEDRIYQINPYDEVAVEMACQLKKSNPETRIIGVTLGEIIAESELRRCMALGIDRMIHIDHKSHSTDPWQKANFLAQAVRTIKPDIVLCGKESLDSQNGQVAAFLAHHLKLPFISAITQFSVADSKAVIERNAGKGIKEQIACDPPAVFSVDMADIEPHMPSYEEKKNAWAIPLESVSVNFEKTDAKISCDKRFPPSPRPKKVFSIDTQKDAFHRVGQLLSGTRIKKKGQMLTGSPEYLAKEMVSFLEENNLLDFTSKQEENR